jgi:transcriptional regulator with XRE-family HTH domain
MPFAVQFYFDVLGPRVMRAVVLKGDVDLGELPHWMALRRQCEERLYQSPIREGGGDIGQGTMTAPERGPAAVALASWLTALRERERISVRELARRLEMPASTVAAYLSGTSIPASKDRLDALLRGLNANSDEHDFAVACWADFRIGMDGPTTASDNRTLCSASAQLVGHAQSWSWSPWTCIREWPCRSFGTARSP